MRSLRGKNGKKLTKIFVNRNYFQKRECWANWGHKFLSIAAYKAKKIELQTENTNLQFKSRPTRVFIHGWAGLSYSTKSFSIIKKTYENLFKVNIIDVRWNPGSPLFHVAREYAMGVGKKVAKFLDRKLGRSLKPWRNLKIIGHSMGAHIAGFVGKNVKNGTIGTIIGLDPAGSKRLKTELVMLKLKFSLFQASTTETNR